MRPHYAARAFAVLILASTPAAASAQQPPAACDGPGHAEFDFWVGSWRVTNPAGATVGHNRIERVSRGCALLENWTSAGGGDGRSLNFHDPVRDAWHQVWVGADGVILRLTGGLERPGRMVLTGEPRPARGGTVRDRITWTLQPDGTVEQNWQISTDDGATWQTAFLGTYHRTD